MKALQKKPLKSLREQATDLVDRTVKLPREKRESNDSSLSIHKPLRDEVLLRSQDHTDIRRSPLSFRRRAREQRSKNSYLRMPYPSLKYDANMPKLKLVYDHWTALQVSLAPFTQVSLRRFRGAYVFLTRKSFIIHRRSEGDFKVPKFDF